MDVVRGMVRCRCEFTACYPENLQNYLVHAQAVASSPHARGPGNETISQQTSNMLWLR